MHLVNDHEAIANFTNDNSSMLNERSFMRSNVINKQKITELAAENRVRGVFYVPVMAWSDY